MAAQEPRKITKSQAEKHLFLMLSAAWERLCQILPMVKKQSLSQSSVFVRQMEITRWRCCFFCNKCLQCENVELWPLSVCECTCVCGGTGEKLTVCVSELQRLGVGTGRVNWHPQVNDAGDVSGGKTKVRTMTLRFG